MIEIALASSLLHPDLFGAAWVILMLVSGWMILRERLMRIETNERLTKPGIQSAAIHKWQSSALFMWVLAFGPLLLLSIISVFIHDLKLSRIEVIEVILGGALLTAAISRLEPDPRRLSWALVVAAFGGACIATYDVLASNEFRAGMMFNSINFGIGCGVIVIILMTWLKFRHDIPINASSNILIAGLLAALTALLASGSRGPIAAFIACIIVAGLLWHKAPQRSKAAFAVMVFGLVATAVLIYQKRFELDLTAGDAASHKVRWELIKLSLLQIQETPLWGIGVDQAGGFFGKFTNPVNEYNHAHMTILNVALELGMFGGIAWLWAFTLIIRFFWIHRNSTSAMLWQTGLLLAIFIFVCSMTSDIMSHSYTRRLFTLALALFMGLCKTQPKKYSAFN